MAKTQVVEGGCLCGAVRYQAEVNLDDVYYCHCRMCQKSSGAPAEIGVRVIEGTLQFTVGEPTFFRSSHFAERGFCLICGSRLLWRPSEGKDQGKANLSVGSLDDPEVAIPSKHICVDSQISWYAIDDGLPRLKSDEMPFLVSAWSN